MIAKNIAHAAILAGHTVLFRTVSDLFAELDLDSPAARRRKFRFYARPALLVLDEVGYLAYDAHAADLLFEIVNHRAAAPPTATHGRPRPGPLFLGKADGGDTAAVGKTPTVATPRARGLKGRTSIALGK